MEGSVAAAPNGSAPSQGQSAGDVQPQASGQGEPGADATAQGGASAGEFNWGLFPDVPEESRPLLEPHLKNVQSHVTKLEQEHAPFKPFAQAGISAEDAQGLIGLNQGFNTDPVGTLVQLVTILQQNGAISDNLDVESLKAIASGQDIEIPDASGEQPAGAPQGEDIPEWAQGIVSTVDELKQFTESQQQKEQQATQQQIAAQEEAQLKEVLGNMSTTLKESGYTDDTIPDEDTLTGLLIAHKGDPDKVIQSLGGLRTGVLKGFTQDRQAGSDTEPDMPKGVPGVSKRGGRGPEKEWADARAGAAQALMAKQRAGAQS